MIRTKDGKEHNLTREEMEVSVVFNAKDKTALIHSTYPKINRKLDKLCEEHPEAYTRIPDPNGIEDEWRKYEIDKRMIVFRRPVSKAQAEAARKRMVEKNEKRR